jgi:hypothetical protein
MGGSSSMILEKTQEPEMRNESRDITADLTETKWITKEYYE